MRQKTENYGANTGNFPVLALKNCQKGLIVANFGSPAAITLDRYA